MAEAIAFIQGSFQISTTGVLSRLEQTVLKPGGQAPNFDGEAPQVFTDIRDYHAQQRGLEARHTETDSQVGALARLNEIYNRYTPQ